ncbi:hypothetical protein [Leifsonia kafniensis]|uniref:hypothetical protein n=1 Tax=Leifsonia kafniensis TaxID=475957 RepID=UPI0031E76156
MAHYLRVTPGAKEQVCILPSNWSNAPLRAAPQRTTAWPRLPTGNAVTTPV